MPRAIKTGDLTFLGVALTVMIALSLASYGIAPPQGLELRGSTYSARRQGAKAAFLLLEQLGYKIERSFEPIANLRAEPSETVLIIASPVKRASLQDLRALRSFVERGGVVIATGGGGSFLPELESASIVETGFLRNVIEQSQRDQGKTPARELEPQFKPSSYRAAMPSLLTRNAPTLLLESEIEGIPPQGESYLPLYASEKGPGVLLASFGQGYALWAIGSTPFLNEHLEKPGDLEFLLNAIGGRDRNVLWDEYYHGYDRSLISYLATTQLSTIFAQLALIGFVALFTFSRRRGPARPLLVRPRTSPMEFVDAVSALYQKARASHGAVETMRARLRRVLITTLQLPANSGDPKLAAAAATRYGIDESELRDLLKESAEASNELALPAERALTLVQRMQAMVRQTLE